LGLRFLTKEEILLILEQARLIKGATDQPIQPLSILQGKTVVNLFFEPSTRTRTSFEMAIKLMGANPLNINVNTSSITKGESLFDTVQNLAAMGVDAIIVRHKHGGVPNFIAEHLKIPVINAGDGYCEHPTQGLLDLLTMLEHRKSVENKNVLILGDIYHSRVARSNIWALTKLGAKVTVCGPATLIPAQIAQMGVRVSNNLDDIIADMDFINVLRIQYERQEDAFFPSVREYRALYCLTEERLKKAKSDVLVLHPGPMNRGIEIDSAVADGPKNVILQQVTNGVAIRMAVLQMLLTRS
jgi:aspartate carbamoyltransferase catalytic subunit